MIKEFLDDIINNCPQIIVDNKNPQIPMFGFPIYTETINIKVEYIKSHYEAVEDVGSWTIYKFINAENCQ